MAKLAFSKLGIKMNNIPKKIKFNNHELEIKQYLPLREKMDLVNGIVENAISINPNYYNPAEIKIAQAIAIVGNYTNLSFTDKQLSDTLALYDLFISSGLYQLVIDNIPAPELQEITALVHDSLSNYFGYINSVGGVLQTAAQSTENIKELKDLVDNSDLSFLKEIMTHLG
jgi:hypothetical protein